MLVPLFFLWLLFSTLGSIFKYDRLNCAHRKGHVGTIVEHAVGGRFGRMGSPL